MDVYDRVGSLDAAHRDGALGDGEWAELRLKAWRGEDVYAYTAIGSRYWYVRRGDLVDPVTGYRGLRVGPLEIGRWTTVRARERQESVA